ncbi:MAG: hypothetical protein M1825_002933 [Sarcosagium campestre]|nr:MAG: hypothetical protein M1825_002933 [Sarcosagium campestre]
MAKPTKRKRSSAVGPDEGGEPLKPSSSSLQSTSVETPFHIYRPARSRKSKKQKGPKGVVSWTEPVQPEDDQFSGSLAIPYTVRPQQMWNSMRKYRNFTGRGADASDSDEPDRSFWVARVIEIRAKDQHHVYLRVYWMYWPEELPGGARYYHGKRELVASNHMDIIDAMTVCGKVDLQRLEEGDDDPPSHDLYWRQTFSLIDQKLSASLRIAPSTLCHYVLTKSSPQDLTTYCVCRKFHNPDTELIRCSNPHCTMWLHRDCILDDVLAKTHKRITSGSPDPALDTPGKDNDTRPGSESGDGAPPWKNLFSARLEFRNESGDAESKPKVLISDLRGESDFDDSSGIGKGLKTWEEDIVCLQCLETIA